MAHRALKAHTFPEAYEVNLVTKRPKTSPEQQQLQASVAARCAIAGQIGVDRSIGETRMGIEIGFKSAFGFILP
jgi:hypothetical protein